MRILFLITSLILLKAVDYLTNLTPGAAPDSGLKQMNITQANFQKTLKNRAGMPITKEKYMQSRIHLQAEL